MCGFRARPLQAAPAPVHPEASGDHVKVAILYDYLQTVGGGERVVLTLAKHLPGDIITTAFDEDLPSRAGFPGVHVISLGDILLQPPLKQIHASWKFARARLNEYDFYFLVGNWAHYAARRLHPNVYYCLTPTRSFYDQRGAMMARLGIPNRWVAWMWSSAHSRFERRSIQHCDDVVAISENVRRRVQRPLTCRPAGRGPLRPASERRW